MLPRSYAQWAGAWRTIGFRHRKEFCYGWGRWHRVGPDPTCTKGNYWNKDLEYNDFDWRPDCLGYETPHSQLSPPSLQWWSFGEDGDDHLRYLERKRSECRYSTNNIKRNHEITFQKDVHRLSHTDRGIDDVYWGVIVNRSREKKRQHRSEENCW